MSPVPGDGHPGIPVPGTWRTRDGREVNPIVARDYPALATCRCGYEIECLSLLATGWLHTGRRPGETGTVTP